MRFNSSGRGFGPIPDKKEIKVTVDAFDEGYNAFHEGQDDCSNPYSASTHKAEGIAWEDGYWAAHDAAYAEDPYDYVPTEDEEEAAG